MRFTDRSDAGRALAERLMALRGEDVVVLGLPRGGVPVAFEVARALRAPLDVVVVRKLGVHCRPELAMGAIGEEGVRVVNGEIVRRAGVSAGELAAVERAERAELRRRVEAFRAGRGRIDLAGRTALIVDDGVATGATARAACQVAWALGAARVVLAVPVGEPGAIAALRRDADEVVCLAAPAGFTAVGQWYHRLGQVSDGEVAGLLGRFPDHPASGVSSPAGSPGRP
ncbi:phosphoribosyltransferase [Amycolatopsis tucumanensis]|uniref:Phosphoribosyltransferase domain-containing protein n=1 Tax=Amycolatopsis tucumanensis TaxID=401106 RepID=A0ABP7HK08_9PSEU|nr:phosphoribosyltransferase family protein [Amycolatopsis tucumanensis]MCF6428796.1 phosphoribosyltransferase [Amycolatopsis tucumanensis]